MAAPATRFAYDVTGVTYARRRRTDARIAAPIHAALGAARSVLIVGAGTGSYEPAERTVAAVDASRATITPVPIPDDCEDGFLGAYWKRPKALAADLSSGRWHARNAHLLESTTLDIGYRLVVAKR